MPKAPAILAPVPSVSPFHNLSDGDLVDQLGAIKAELADVKAREDELKAQLIARGLPEAEGALFRATVSQGVRWTLDVERVRAEMGAAWCDQRSKVASVTGVRISARTGTRKAA